MHTLATKCNRENSSQISMNKNQHDTVDIHKMNNQHQMAVKRDYSEKLRNIVYSYQPIYYVSRIFGLLPFSLTYESSGEIKMPKITKFDGIWFVISIAIYLVFPKVILLSIDIQTSPSVPILILGHKLLLIVGLIYAAIIICENMCSRFKFVKILKIFTAFDNEASQELWFFILTF